MKRGTHAQPLPAHPSTAVPTGSSSGWRWGRSGPRPAEPDSRRPGPVKVRRGARRKSGRARATHQPWIHLAVSRLVGPSVCSSLWASLRNYLTRRRYRNQARERGDDPTCARSGRRGLRRTRLCGGHVASLLIPRCVQEVGALVN